MRTVRFIDQHEDVAAFIADFALSTSGFELINNRGDDARLIVANQFQQMFAGFSLHYRLAAGMESFVNLVVQVYAICHQHNLGIDYLR